MALFADEMEIDIQEIWPKLKHWEPLKTRVAPLEQMSGRLAVTQLQYKADV